MLDGSSGGHCGPPIGHHSIKVFGMYCAPPPPTHPLFSGEPRVIQPTLAYEVDRPIRLIGPHIGGDRLNERPKLLVVAPNSLFRTQAVSHINYRTYEFPEIPRRAERRVAYHVDIPGLAVRVNDSVIHLEVRLVPDGFLEPFPGRGLIIGMNSLEERLESRWRFGRVES